MIQEEKLKYFIDTKRHKKTQSFNIAKKWIESGIEVRAILSTYSTMKIISMSRNTFLTESGNSYIIVELEGNAENVMVERFKNKTAFTSCYYKKKKDLKTLASWIENSDDVYAKFFSNKDGKMAYTNRIFYFNLDKKLIIISDGKMYQLRSPS